MSQHERETSAAKHLSTDTIPLSQAEQKLASQKHVRFLSPEAYGKQITTLADMQKSSKNVVIYRKPQGTLSSVHTLYEDPAGDQRMRSILLAGYEDRLDVTMIGDVNMSEVIKFYKDEDLRNVKDLHRLAQFLNLDKKSFQDHLLVERTIDAMQQELVAPGADPRMDVFGDSIDSDEARKALVSRFIDQSRTYGPAMDSAAIGLGRAIYRTNVYSALADKKVLTLKNLAHFAIGKNDNEPQLLRGGFQLQRNPVYQDDVFLYYELQFSDERAEQERKRKAEPSRVKQLMTHGAWNRHPLHE